MQPFTLPRLKGSNREANPKESEIKPISSSFPSSSEDRQCQLKVRVGKRACVCMCTGWVMKKKSEKADRFIHSLLCYNWVPRAHGSQCHKRQKPDFKFPVRSYPKASTLKRLGGRWVEAVAKSSHGATGADNTGARPTGLRWCGEKGYGIDVFNPCVEQTPEKWWKWWREQSGAERKSAELGGCRSCWVSPGTKADGLATGHAPPWTQSHLKAWGTYTRPTLSQGYSTVAQLWSQAVQ